MNFKLQITPNFKNNNGFTLIELVFVLGIFFIVIAVATDIFISMIQQQKRILKEQELLNQTSYAMEYMSKALRMAAVDSTGNCLGTAGHIYLLTHCNSGTLEACQGVKFINQSDNNVCQEFFLDDIANPASPSLKEVKNGGLAQNILSDKFRVIHFKFIVNGDQSLHGASNSDLLQPRITVLFDSKTKDAQNPIEKILQTTVSPRNLNVP